jgi:hypothetical protein
MRSLFLVAALAACGSDDAAPDAGLPRLVVAGRVDIFTVTSTPDINCGSGADACDASYAATTDVTVSIVNHHPESCFFWGAMPMPDTAGACTVSGAQGTCTLHIDRAVTLTVGGCVNP